MASRLVHALLVNIMLTRSRIPLSPVKHESDASSASSGSGDTVKERKPVKKEKMETKVKVKQEEEWMTGWQPPENWQQLVANIRSMRSAADAPVDSVGCEKTFDPDDPPEKQRFEVLVSLMLSSQTKDEVTHAATKRLHEAGLSPQMILDMDPDQLGELIKPVGFWRKKVVYLKKVSEILMRDYSGDIPNTVEGLCGLPGVGPKMSHLAMLVAWNQVTGIAVDTHVHRICHRLKFVQKVTKDPKQTEQQIEDWIPRHMWKDFNHLLVGFGQTICTPLNPKCDQCLNCNICPSAQVKKRAHPK